MNTIIVIGLIGKEGSGKEIGGVNFKFPNLKEILKY